MSLDWTRLLGSLRASYGDEASSALEHRLHALLQRTGVPPRLAQSLLDYLAERVPAGLRDASALGDWQLDDLFLCHCCLCGARGAVDTFRAEHRRTLEAALGRLRLSPSLQAEAQQSLEALLLAGEEGRPPLLAQYSGLGKLGAWLRVVAARHGRRLLEREKRLLPLDDDHLADQLGGGANPELAHLKRTYRDAFKQAFGDGMRILGARQLNLLRHRYLDGLTVAEIGTIYRVHHSTVSRWITEAREQVLAETHRRLMTTLQVSPDECASLVELLRSQLDLTLSRFFEQSWREPGTGA